MVAKQLEVSEQTLQRWRAQYGGLKADDAKRLKELERENARLKRIVADPLLENQALEGGWTDKRGARHPAHCSASQRLKELLGQRARQCGRPRVSH